MKKCKNIAYIGRECVACGCCATVCPFGAIHIHNGVRAQVDNQKCVACGKCARICPAAVILIQERNINHEK